MFNMPIVGWWQGALLRLYMCLRLLPTHTLEPSQLHLGAVIIAEPKPSAEPDTKETGEGQETQGQEGVGARIAAPLRYYASRKDVTACDIFFPRPGVPSCGPGWRCQGCLGNACALSPAGPGCPRSTSLSYPPAFHAAFFLMAPMPKSLLRGLIPKIVGSNLAFSTERRKV